VEAANEESGLPGAFFNGAGFDPLSQMRAAPALFVRSL